jgi:hypothetical protein
MIARFVDPAWSRARKRSSQGLLIPSCSGLHLEEFQSTGGFLRLKRLPNIRSRSSMETSPILALSKNGIHQSWFCLQNFFRRKLVGRGAEGNLTHLKAFKNLIKKEVTFLIHFLNKVNKTSFR